MLSITLGIVMSISNIHLMMYDLEITIPILLSIIGLSLTAYTFISVPIQKVASKKSDDKTKGIRSLLKEYKENMLFIFLSCIIYIIIDFILKINFPFIKNPCNLDFGLFQIISLKAVFYHSIQNILFFLSLYSFYDIMKATFIIIEKSIFED